MEIKTEKIFTHSWMYCDVHFSFQFYLDTARRENHNAVLIGILYSVWVFVHTVKHLIFNNL